MGLHNSGMHQFQTTTFYKIAPNIYPFSVRKFLGVSLSDASSFEVDILNEEFARPNRNTIFLSLPNFSFGRNFLKRCRGPG
jgi:hypothetical protein